VKKSWYYWVVPFIKSLNENMVQNGFTMICLIENMPDTFVPGFMIQGGL